LCNAPDKLAAYNLSIFNDITALVVSINAYFEHKSTSATL